MHQHVAAARRRVLHRQEQGGERPAPPRLSGGDPQPRAAGRDRLPGQGQHVHPLISHPGELPEPEGTAVMLNLLLWYGSAPAPIPEAGRDDRRSSPGRASSHRAPRRPGAADLTPPGELSVDAADPGRQASRASRPPRGTAVVARCGRSVPSAAARDPRRPRHPRRPAARAPASEEADTVTSISQPAALGRYLTRRGFAPSSANPAWLDRVTGRQVIRVLHEPGETTFLYCLDPHQGCL